MARKCFLLLVIVIFTIFAFGSKQFANAEKGDSKKQLKFITAVEGKSFYSGYDSPYWSWFKAGPYCESYGMKLATITSVAQANALKNAYKEDLKGWYWTSGRDAQTWRQFSWNQTNEVVAGIINFGDWIMLPQTCLKLEYFGSTDDLFSYWADECKLAGGALCETTEIL